MCSSDLVVWHGGTLSQAPCVVSRYLLQNDALGWVLSLQVFTLPVLNLMNRAAKPTEMVLYP